MLLYERFACAAFLFIVAAGTLAVADNTDESSQVNNLLTRSKELIHNTLKVWWVPPLLAFLFIISSHIWVYIVMHMLWLIASLFSSNVSLKR